MSKYETTIIPLDEAHEVLGAFDISQDSWDYQRWRRADGFRWCDFEDMLNESPLVLVIDWRESLEEAVEAIVEQLNSLEISADVEFDDTGDRGELQIGGRKEAIKYVPADGDDFDVVIESINRLLQGRAQYRKLRWCEDSDSWAYGLLTKQDWRDLEANAAPTLELLFYPG